jgi:hypothetical protein
MEAGHNGALGLPAANLAEVATPTDTGPALTPNHHVVDKTALDLMLNLRSATVMTVTVAMLHLKLVHLSVQGHAKTSETRPNVLKLMNVTTFAGNVRFQSVSHIKHCVL